MTDNDFAAQVTGVGALADPTRRAVYQYVVGQSDAVSRDQAAAGAALPRHTVKFHLDRLVDEGLLATEFRRLSGRRGPGAGRPAKLYRRSDRQLTVTLPERRYDLAGQILAEAVEHAAGTGTPVAASVAEAAAGEGRRLAVRDGGGSAAPLAETTRVLAERGYEPRAEGAGVILANCPFSALARDHPALVCGMNLSLITGFLTERGYSSIEAALDPAENRCCVTLAEVGAAAAANGGRGRSAPR